MAKHEEKHEESLMEKIAEKIHVYDSSSSSLDSDDDKPSASLIKAKFCRFFGRERPVHLVFDGVKPGALGVATVIWVLFEFAKEAKVFNAKPIIKFNLFKVCPMLLLVPTTGTRVVGTEDIGSPLIPGNTAMNSFLVNKSLRVHKLSERREMVGTEAAAMNDNINYKAFQCGNSPPNNPVGSNKGKKKVLISILLMLLLVLTTGIRGVGSEEIGSPLIPGNTAMNSLLVNKNLRGHKLSERREMGGTEAAAMNDNINYSAFQRGNSPPNNPVGKQANPYKRSCNPGEYCRQGNKGKKKG